MAHRGLGSMHRGQNKVQVLGVNQSGGSTRLLQHGTSTLQSNGSLSGDFITQTILRFPPDTNKDPNEDIIESRET